MRSRSAAAHPRSRSQIWRAASSAPDALLSRRRPAPRLPGAQLTVEKKGKKNIFSGRILEIEGLEHLKCEQAFELSDASAERSAAGCTIKLDKVRARHLRPAPAVTCAAALVTPRAPPTARELSCPVRSSPLRALRLLVGCLAIGVRLVRPALWLRRTAHHRALLSPAASHASARLARLLSS